VPGTKQARHIALLPLFLEPKRDACWVMSEVELVGWKIKERMVMHNRNAVAKKVRASLKMIVMSKNMLQTQLFIYSIAACTCSLPPRTVYSIRPTTHHSIHAPRRLLSTLCPVQCCTLILGADHSFTGTLWTPKCT